MRIMKFGGSSLATPRGLKTVVELTAEGIKREPVVIVTSAVGGVTDSLDRLLSSPSECRKEALAGFQNTHLGLWQDSAPEEAGGFVRLEKARFRVEVRRILEELDFLGWAAPSRGGWDPPSRDRALGIGETLSAHLVASLLRAWGVASLSVEGRYVIRTDSTFGEAEVHQEETEGLVREVLGKCPGAVPVIGGFTGSDARGRPTTLGRGSSDFTAALVGRALGARVVEIWTDVDGVFRQDPRKVPGASVLSHLPYGEARAMARAGAKVLHPRTLDPLEPLGIPLRVRNTLNPRVAGTWVGPRASSPVRPSKAGGFFRSVEKPLRTASLILAGATGGVGSAVREQLARVAPALEEEGWALKLVGALNSRGLAWEGEGLLPGALRGALRGASQGPQHGALSGALPPALTGERGPQWDEVVRRLDDERPPNPVFVDCTASQEVSSRYLSILEGGIPIVTANKLAGSGDLGAYRTLQAVARQRGIHFRYETTVGAALPVLGTVRDLLRVGDSFRGVQGVLSGTLSFVFAKVAKGLPFSEAVREAWKLGLTEPHPGEDLRGADVGRKLVILLREAGFDVEADSIPVESLVPEALEAESDPEAFLTGLGEYDVTWAERTAAAENRGEVLTYAASFDGDVSEVGVRSVLQGHPLGAVEATENVVLLETDLYPDVPLKISGPGAGREVTAAGVLTDVLAVLR